MTDFFLKNSTNNRKPNHNKLIFRIKNITENKYRNRIFKKNCRKTKVQIEKKPLQRNSSTNS